MRAMKFSEWMKDWILAIYSDAQQANDVRMRLFASGIATDRLDVTTWQNAGRAMAVSPDDPEHGLRGHFSVLFEGRADAERGVQDIIESLQAGKACVTVHPRGVVEIRECRLIIDESQPQKQYLNLLPLEHQGGLLGEHAAGG